MMKKILAMLMFTGFLSQITCDELLEKSLRIIFGEQNRRQFDDVPNKAAPLIELIGLDLTYPKFEGDDSDLIVTASDFDGKINSLEIYLDGELEASSASNLILVSSFFKDLPINQYSLKVIARHNKGTAVKSELSFEIQEKPNLAPRIDYHFPYTVYLEEDYGLTVHARDYDGDIDLVNVFINDVRVAQKFVGDFTLNKITENLGVGAHTLRVTARDNRGKYGSKSFAFKILSKIQSGNVTINHDPVAIKSPLAYFQN